MTRKSVIFFFCSSILALAEPSAFELQSGATKSNVSSLQLGLKVIQNIATDLQNRVASLEQTQGAFQSLIEGQNLKIKNFTDSFFALQKNFDELKAENQAFEDELKRSNTQIDELKAQVLSQQEDIKKLQTSLQELNRTVTESNNSIIQQLTLMSQFLEKTQKMQALSQEDKAQSGKSDANAQANKDSNAETTKLKKSNKDNFADAKSLIRSKDYAKAEYILNELIKKNYKTAEAYFMLGDIFYRKKDYVSAVDCYKKSATMDEKATYMPVLLWRTAWSFKHLNDMSNYQKFIDILVRLYPDSEQAKKAVNEKTDDSVPKKQAVVDKSQQPQSQNTSNNKKDK